MFLNILFAAIGFVILIKCADFFVDGASAFAKNLKIPTAIIGLTIVSFGTSAPELAISFGAHLSGNTDMLFGNVIGTNIANIFVILGVAVLIAPFKIHNDIIKKEIPILLLITLGMSVLFLDNVFDPKQTNALSIADGIIMILFFSIFIYYLFTLLASNKNATVEKPKYKILRSVAMIVIGLAGIIFASDLVVDNIADFALRVGISQKVISVTIIAIGTSLPELVTTVLAVKKGENNMAIGNIVGSNIFNICIVLGLPIILLGDAATASYGLVDMIFMVLAVVLLLIFSSTNRELKRFEAVIFLAIYCMYGWFILM